MKSGGTLHVVNGARRRGTAHVHRRRQEGPAEDGGAGEPTARSASKLGQAHGADPNSDAPPKFPFLENGVGQDTPPERGPAGRLRHHRPGQEGRVDRPQGHGQEGHGAVLHVPDPPVDAGQGQRHSRAWAVRTARGPWRSPASSRCSPRPRRAGARAGARRTGSRRCRRRGTSCPTAATRSWGRTSTAADAIFPTVVYRRYTSDWEQPLANAPRAERRRAARSRAR